MGFHFRRSVRILRSIRIDLDKRSASVTVGGRGAHVTLLPGHKVRATVGLPGSDLSYTAGGKIVHPHVPGDRSEAAPRRQLGPLVACGRRVDVDL